MLMQCRYNSFHLLYTPSQLFYPNSHLVALLALVDLRQLTTPKSSVLSPQPLPRLHTPDRLSQMSEISLFTPFDLWGV